MKCTSTLFVTFSPAAVAPASLAAGAVYAHKDSASCASSPGSAAQIQYCCPRAHGPLF